MVNGRPFNWMRRVELQRGAHVVLLLRAHAEGQYRFASPSFPGFDATSGHLTPMSAPALREMAHDVNDRPLTEGVESMLIILRSLGL
jgi:hypothetical protein